MNGASSCCGDRKNGDFINSSPRLIPGVQSCCGDIINPSPLLVPGAKSWYDFYNAVPRSPLDLIACAATYEPTGGLISKGVLKNNSTILDPTATWQTDVMSVGGLPVCKALGTDDKEKEADAAQWNFSHKTWYESGNVAPPLHKVLFLRAGTDWKMSIPLQMTATLQTLFVTFRNNLATRGDAQGTIPVLELSIADNSAFILEVTLRFSAHVSMALIHTDSEESFRAYESEWLIVP
jgi:hypothetical protein